MTLKATIESLNKSIEIISFHLVLEVDLNDNFLRAIIMPRTLICL